LLDRAGTLPSRSPEDGEAIQPGRVYVAPADRHLLLDHGTMRVVFGPRHNRHRPAIDPFYSASRAFGSRAAGVILAGALDDGVAGLSTIRRRGGHAIVQDPDTTVFHSMPRHARLVVPDAEMVAPEQLASAITRAVALPADGETPPDARLDRYFKEYLGQKLDIEAVGAPSVYACPECSGVLWHVDDGQLIRFECRIGHSFTAEGLLAEHDASVEQALSTALRALEENASLQRRVAARLALLQSSRLAEDLERKIRQLESSADVLRGVLARIEKGPEELDHN